MNKTLLVNLLICGSLTACGGGGSSSSDNTAPSVTLEKAWAEDGSTILAANESLVFNFSEGMQPNTLSLGGSMAPNCGDETDALACLEQVWNEDTTQLTLTPKDGFYWYANTGTLEMAITGDSNANLSTSMSATVLPFFGNHQAADIVIGQESFTDSDGTTSNKGLHHPLGINLVEESGTTSLLIADSRNNRIVKYNTIPTSNNAVHSALFGQPNSESSDSGNSNNQLESPIQADYIDGMFYISDGGNQRSIALSEDEFNTTGIASTIVGKENFGSTTGTGCTADNLGYSYGLEMVKHNGELYWFVTDTEQGRIMVWNNPASSAGADASFVLGQDSADSCLEKSANSEGLNVLNTPTSIWSNGEKLIAVSAGDSRLLVWNEIPTTSGKAPDFQLGQPDDFSTDQNSGQDTPNQKGFYNPTAIGGNDHQICLADSGQNRVVVWHSLPTSNLALADAVIGQQDFYTDASNDSVTSQNLNRPRGCDMSMEQLFVSDTRNNRVLIYNALNKRP